MGRTNSTLMYTRNLQHIGSGETSSKYGGGGGTLLQQELLRLLFKLSTWACTPSPNPSEDSGGQKVDDKIAPSLEQPPRTAKGCMGLMDTGQSPSFPRLPRFQDLMAWDEMFRRRPERVYGRGPHTFGICQLVGNDQHPNLHGVAPTIWLHTALNLIEVRCKTTPHRNPGKKT